MKALLCLPSEGHFEALFPALGPTAEAWFRRCCRGDSCATSSFDVDGDDCLLSISKILDARFLDVNQEYRNPLLVIDNDNLKVKMT